MTLPPLRTGLCTIAGCRYPVIVGKTEGETREIFICGVHIDRFCNQLPDGGLPEGWGMRFDLGGHEL